MPLKKMVPFRNVQKKTAAWTFLVNFVGAVLVFFYWAAVAPLPRSGQVVGAIEPRLLWVFGIIILITIGGGTWQSLRAQREIGVWYERLQNGETTDRVPRYVRRQLLNYPLYLGSLSFAMWILAAFGMAFGTADQNWIWTTLTIIGTGGVLAAPLVYLGTELFWRPLVGTFFPTGKINEVGAHRVSVLSRLMLVFTLSGIYPVLLVLLATLFRLPAILEAKNPRWLLSNLVVADLFILIATVLAGAGMVTLTMRGLRRSLASLQAAMSRAGRDDFDAQVAVTTNDELGYLGERFNQMTARLRQGEQLRNLLNLYISPEVARNAMQNGATLGGRTVTCTVLFSDIRAFTSLAEQLTPDELIEMLNRYMSVMIEVVTRNGGFVNKFGGDSLLAVFGTPLNPARDHAARAVRTAQGMCAELNKFNEFQRQMKMPEIQVGIGVASGPVVAGNVGGRGRLEYTVLGDTVNQAARLQFQATELGYAVLLNAEAYRDARSSVLSFEAQELPPVTVRGREEPVAVYGIEYAPCGEIQVSEQPAEEFIDTGEK